jgi:hypothetical protein
MTMNSDDDDQCDLLPWIVLVSLSVQLQKALAADDVPVEVATKGVGEKRKIPMNYFCHGKMMTSHAHDVCFSNRTMSPEEKERLLPKEVTRLYDERRHMMDWVVVKLERRIWKYARGEKIYKEGETGALVERFQDIQLAWKMSGTDRM